MRRKVIQSCLWLICMAAGVPGYCQVTPNDTLVVKELTSKIFQLQAKGDSYFPPGLFPTYREYQLNKGVLKYDDNVFFTGLVVFTLRSLMPYLDKDSAEMCDSIFSRANPLYSKYQNKKGRYTYNFWQTEPPQIFPNAGWLNLFNKSQALPDDMDDTAIILMAKEEHDSIVKEVHGVMQGFTNNTSKKVKSSLPEYKNIQAYSTWFGVKMPVEFDVCVLCNVLYMVHAYKLAYSKVDSASMLLIRRVVQNRDYIKAPEVVSSPYSRPSVILYHLARLMSQRHIPELEVFRGQLIADAVQTYKKSNNFMDKVILSTALLKWDKILPDELIILDQDIKSFVEESDFVFFVANISAMLPYPLNKWLGKSGVGKFHYYCPAYNYVLLLENAIWRKQVLNRRR